MNCFEVVYDLVQWRNFVNMMRSEVHSLTIIFSGMLYSVVWHTLLDVIDKFPTCVIRVIT